MQFWVRLSALLPVFVTFLAGTSPLGSRQDSSKEKLERAVSSPIQFSYQAIDFRLNNSETAERHAPETMAGGVAVFDYNNDGKLDIFFANGADIRSLKKDSSQYYNRLFENDGEGHFIDVTQKAGLAGTGYDDAVAIGDYDNDGYEDLFVGGVYRNTLYHNNGNGTFTDVTQQAGLSSPDLDFGQLWAIGGIWLDVNNDGLLDLMIINYLKWDPAHEPVCQGYGHRDYCHPKMYKPTPNQLFLNLGKGKFKDVSSEWGLRAHPGKGMGAAGFDYDHDGHMDVFVTNDKEVNYLFHNTGNKLEEVGFNANVSLREDGIFISGMGTDARDLDNDGFSDIVLVALDGETFPIYRNDGKGGFIDATESSGMAKMSLGMGGYSPNIADFDNDGWKDIFVSRGHVQSLLSAPTIKVEQYNSVFRNLGGLRFQALTVEAGFSSVAPSRHRGAAVGDLNGDGLLDVVVSALNAPSEVWINRSPGDHHWLEIKLEGTHSNRDGIGTSVKIVSVSGTQFNHKSNAAGYASSSSAPIHFGLGKDKAVSLVEIHWPSGRIQTLKEVPSDQVLTVKEPDK